MCSMIRCTEGGTGSREAVTGYAYPACHGQASPVWVASHRRPGRSPPRAGALLCGFRPKSGCADESPLVTDAVAGGSELGMVRTGRSTDRGAWPMVR
jgi:hypothetical protein